MRVSIIVPVLNEGATLGAFLSHLRELNPSSEIVVVDGGSNDRSLEIAREQANRAETSTAGRAVQMNMGAKIASGDVFWFLHADSIISTRSVATIQEVFVNPDVVGGCFRLRINSPRVIYRVRDAIGNLLVDLTGIALGDRGFFCRREIFFDVGGFPEIPILEDAEFYRKMKSRGRVLQLGESVGTSPRRYEALGPVKTMLFYSLIMLLYLARVPIPKLERMVYGYRTRGAPAAGK
jgi:rSAM/selenodomain-associated transferase 2